MENTTRLLQRHEATLAQHHVLIVEADDPALANLPARSLQLHSDDSSLPGRQQSWLPVLPTDTDLAVIILPKSRDRLRLVLACLAGQIHKPLLVWLVGPTGGGIKGGATDLADKADTVIAEDSARHCKLFSASLRPAPFSLDNQRCHWSLEGLQVVSYPGVFSHGRLDEGSALLLQVLAQQDLSGSVLDMGCGAGVLSATLARAGLTVTAVDVSATAVAATLETLQANGLHAQVLAGDLYGPIRGRFDQIITNPPFHDGLQRTTSISERLIMQAPNYLKDGGRLILVANQGLPYETWLNKAFARVGILAESRRFRVWQAYR
ncbi:MAG: methyltransferase [Alcanivoracaceae bacterium]|jgi:16S rRNA (guanine1207-N2)-methyltransferase|nr:methyltransferase [Alcanivoracaceae bacterium]